MSDSLTKVIVRFILTAAIEEREMFKHLFLIFDINYLLILILNINNKQIEIIWKTLSK